MSAPRSAKGRHSLSGCPSGRPQGTETVAIRQRWLRRKLVLAGLIAAIAVSWGGCTTIKSVFSPPPAPTVPVPPPAPVPPKKEPVAPVPEPAKKESEAPPLPKTESEAPPAKKEAPPAPAKVPLPPPAPAPAKKEPVAPAPPKKDVEVPQPPKKEPEAPPEKKESDAPPPVLAPQVGKSDEEQLRRTAVSRIQRVEQLVAQLEGKSLTGEQQERLMTVRSLLGNARDALTAQDLTKASNLADKARLLAEELSQSVK